MTVFILQVAAQHKLGDPSLLSRSSAPYGPITALTAGIREYDLYS